MRNYGLKQTEADEKALQMVKKRYSSMHNARSKRDKKRKEFDFKRENEIKKNYDVYGNAKANPKIPFEQILIETYLGMTERGIPVKMTAEGRVDGGVLEAGKYVFEHFLEKEMSIEEIRTYRQRKARYGTGVIYSGVWCESRSVAKGNVENWFAKKGERMNKKIRHIGVKSIDIRSCYFDERAKKIEEAVDCIMLEHISIEEFKSKYCEGEGDKMKSIEGIKNAEYVQTTIADSQHKTNTDGDIETDRNVTLLHYWNKISGEYILIGEENITLYNDYMNELHGMLPLIPVQHYPDSENLYGIGIPERFEAVKPYINSFLKVTLDSARRDAGDAIILMGNSELSGETYITPGETTVWQFTGDKEQILPYKTQSNIQQNVAILQLMDDYGIVCTGLNVKGTYSSPANTAFEAGIMKDEQNNRLKSVVTNDNIGLDRAFTIMRSNIIQFAPYLIVDYLYDDTTQAFEGNMYEIRIDGKRMEYKDRKDEKGKKYKSYDLIDDEGEYAMFKVDKENMLMFKGMKLNIETPTTLNITKTIEREQFPTMLGALANIKNMFPNANLGDGEDVIRKFMMTYDVDTTNYSTKSKKDKIKEEQNKIIEAISSFNSGFQLNEDSKQPTVPTTQGQDPMIRGGEQGPQSQIGQSLQNSIASSTVQ